jgi:hypothetical protein
MHTAKTSDTQTFVRPPQSITCANLYMSLEVPVPRVTMVHPQSYLYVAASLGCVHAMPPVVRWLSSRGFPELPRGFHVKILIQHPSGTQRPKNDDSEAFKEFPQEVLSSNMSTGGTCCHEYVPRGDISCVGTRT